MAVVIRLQGLPIVAGTMDIRHFFSGLTIPDGGVHIVGGEHGEAFIVFATDEDARLGMMRTGGSIKGSKVSLLLSSKTEMQNMIELSRRRFEAGSVEGAAGNGNRPGPPATSGGSGRGSMPTTAQGFSNTSATATTATSAHEPISNKNISTFATTSMGNMPSFNNNFSSSSITMGSTMTTAMSSLNSVPPPIPPLPSMQSIPPMPSMPPLPGPPPVSSHPSVPTVSPLTAVPPVPPMSHMPHLSAMPPFNPGVPPPVGPGLATSGPHLSLGSPNHMFLNPMNLNPLNLQAHLKPSITNPDDFYVHLQGLPFNANELEVREFFHGLAVENVRLIRDNMGRSSGRALVKFFAPQDAFEAIKRGAAMLGQRYVEITPASERQWRECGSGILGQNQSKPGHNADQDRHRRGSSSSASPSGRERARSRSPHKQEFCVYLKGLPYEAENKQIFEFFKNLDIVEDSIYIAYGPNGRATGEGFVEFRNEMDYKAALGCHMQYMGSRFIQVHPITKKAMFEKIDAIRKRMQGSQGDQKGSSTEGGKNPRNCAHISNIPYNVSKKDVRLFLNGIQLFEDTLKVLVDSNGNGLGQAIVQFKSEEEALKAERLHRQKLNGRDAFVHLVTFDQMKEIERNPPPQSRRGQKSQGNVHAQVQAQAQAQVQAQVQAQAHAYPAMSGEEFNFLRNSVGSLSNGPPFVTPFTAPGNGLAGPPPLPPLGATLGDVTLGVPPPLVGAHLPGPVLEPPGFRPGGSNGPPGFVGGPESLRGLPPFDNGSRKGGNHNRGGGQGPTGGPQPSFGSASDNLRGPSGGSGPSNPRPTIVKIQNMPFTVTVDEILDFFYGYQVLPGSVCLQFSEKGLPTGEAMVAFESHDEAMSAVMDLNERPIGARKVKLTLG
ncbi:RNA-binding protein 12 [Alosa sapidissima]|uniref:RNA-binding protein 12 n=1 Tax=Alosa sapidissima TaxID=34773 RepID=UPI001C08EF54|nr:RNA-binding protein 12 [Alosa sapidissima]XP_041945068.1 RNA-binding protein 12 [Alosa sapidissima]